MPTTEIAIERLVQMRDDPGSHDQFWKVLERYRADLVNQALVILGNQADAEDVAQDTFSQAFLNLNQLRDTSKLGVWLRGINRNLALNLRRRHVRAKEERLATGQMGALEAPKSATLATGVIRAADRIMQAVDGLPEQSREVLVLHYWEKLSYEQIAERLEIPMGTVCSRVARADRMLARKLKTLMRQENHPQ